MTNTVTPSITIAATELWFDPTGSTKVPREVLFSITQTDPTEAYPAGATIKRSLENVELYLDEKCTKPLVFSENQARLTNADLVKDNGSTKPKGFVAWALGTSPSSAVASVKTKLVLELDALETSEAKRTSDFEYNTKEERIKVDNTAPAGTVDLDVKAAAVVTPALTIGTFDDPDPRVWPDGALTPIAMGFGTVSGDSSATYDGNAELVIEPATAELLVYSDDAGTVPVVVDAGKVAIANASLKATAKLWLRAASNAKPAGVKLTLKLLPQTSTPAQVRVAGSVTQGVMLARTNVVTPKLTVTLPDAFDGALWFPPIAGVTPPSIALQAAQTHADEVPYAGDGLLVRSSSALRLYADEGLTVPVPFFDDELVLPNALLTGDEPLRLYMAATERADVELGFSLYDPKRRAIEVKAAVGQTIACKPVNIVTPQAEYEGTVGPGRLTKVKVYAAQSNALDAPYDKDGTIKRDDAAVAVYRSEANGRGTDGVFAGTELSARMSNDEVVDAGKTWFASWTGANPPGGTAKLKLKLPPSSKPYVVTEPKQQLVMLPDTVAPPVPLAGSNVVTPKIETEYDLVLLATGETAKDVRTTPVRARFFVAQSNAKVAFQGDGKLERSSAGLRVFLDEDCTIELGWSNAQIAVIPNAWLVDPKRTYWLQGATRGKVTLKLSVAAPADGVPPPAVTVVEEVSKELAVVALELQAYRDDGSGGTPIASVAMTPQQQRTRGRVVPVQDPTKQLYGRGRLVVKKVDTSIWPSSADAHVVRLAVSSDRDTVEVFDADDGGSVVASKTTALTLDKGKVGSKDLDYWVQGKAASLEVNDVRIDLGLDRTDGDGWNDRKPLSNGDFVRYTAARIVRVTPDADDWKQYVNQPPDRTLLVCDNQDKAKTGRGILVTATLEPAKPGIGVDFVLWGFDGNGDADPSAKRTPRIPVTLRASDDHVTAVTDDAGKASARITLSRFGGDKFYAVAFLADDAKKSLAELATGEKGKDAPASTKSKQIEVWQKIHYTLAAMKRWNTGDYSARASEGTFRGKYAASFIELERKGNVEIVDHRTILDVNTAVGSWWTNSGLPAPEERTFNLVLVDSLADPPYGVVKEIVAPSSTSAAMMLKGAYDLSSKAAWLVSGSGKVVRRSNGSLIASIDDSNISLAFFGPADYRLSVDISGLLPTGTGPGDVKIKVTILEQSTFSGFSLGPKTFVAMRLREQDASTTYDPTESSTHTMWHETGHYLGLAGKKQPDAANTLNVFWYEGWPSPVTRYNVDKAMPPPPLETLSITQQIGQGPHCRYSARAFNQVYLKSGGWIAAGVSPQCIMYHALSTPITVDYCPDCEKALRGRDLSLPAVKGSDDY